LSLVKGGELQNDLELRERTNRVEAELIAIERKHAGVNPPLPRRE
jgi:hypothetical protein